MFETEFTVAINTRSAYSIVLLQLRMYQLAITRNGIGISSTRVFLYTIDEIDNTFVLIQSDWTRRIYSRNYQIKLY